MTIPTSEELLLLNTHPQQTQLYLSIYEPEIAFICQPTGSYNSSTQSIDYINLVSGSYTNARDFYYQVALIGTTPNKDDVGRTWVRSATDTTIRFVESDHINWMAAQYITVLKLTEIIPVYPRIIQNPADETDVIFYKVWDIAYTNQNSILGTFVNMGSNYAGFIDGGTGTVYWSASGTYNLLGDALTYSWEFEGATITGSSDHTPGNVYYSTPGHYRTILSVESASGRIDTSIRYVSMYDRPGVGDNVPIINWELYDLSGSRDSSGYSARVRVRSDVSKDIVRDGALVIIFGEDWYGNTKQSISANHLGRETIKFVGYIEDGSIEYDYADGYIEFNVISSTNFMSICECFSCSVESKSSPTTWYELLDMDCRRATYHYLAWQSSVLLCCDLEFKNFDDRYIQYFDADRTSLYDAINTVISGARLGRVVSDRLGKIWIEQEIEAINNCATTLPVTMQITKNDWIGTPIIEERQMNDVSFIEIGGISFDPTDGSFGAFLSVAPGVSPAYRGKIEKTQGLALLDQDELNILSGNMYAQRNSRYPNIDMALRGNFSNLDIAPQEQLQLNIEEEDTPRKLVFVDKSFSLRSIAWTWDSTNQVLLPRISLSEITQGFNGTTVVIPDVPPTTGGPLPPSDFPIPSPIPAPISGCIDIYHNSIYVGNACALNFIDDTCTGTV